MTGNMPAAEVDVDVDLVRRLLTSQHPDLAELPIELITNGWDNVMFRLGDDLAVRVPRRASAVPLIEAEQQWLARFAPSLPVPVPAPVRASVPVPPSSPRAAASMCPPVLSSRPTWPHP